MYQKLKSGTTAPIISLRCYKEIQCIKGVVRCVSVRLSVCKHVFHKLLRIMPTDGKLY